MINPIPPLHNTLLLIFLFSSLLCRRCHFTVFLFSICSTVFGQQFFVIFVVVVTLEKKKGRERMECHCRESFQCINFHGQDKTYRKSEIKPNNYFFFLFTNKSKSRYAKYIVTNGKFNSLNTFEKSNQMKKRNFHFI